ncbi:hypothetical protein COL97_10795, partial [Bacillus safensis]
MPAELGETALHVTQCAFNRRQIKAMRGRHWSSLETLGKCPPMPAKSVWLVQVGGRDRWQGSAELAADVIAGHLFTWVVEDLRRRPHLD